MRVKHPAEVEACEHYDCLESAEQNSKSSAYVDANLKDLIPPMIYGLFGGLAIVLGICMFYVALNSPIYARFLTKEERIGWVWDNQGRRENKNEQASPSSMVYISMSLIRCTPIAPSP